jgi:U3 small nucleolar RNA-associated protein 25
MPSELSLFLSSIPKSKAPKTWIQKTKNSSDASSKSQKALRKRQREAQSSASEVTSEDSKKIKTTDSFDAATDNENADDEQEFVAAEIDDDASFQLGSDDESEKGDADAPVDYYESRYNHPTDLDKKIEDVKAKSYTSGTIQFQGSVLEKIVRQDLSFSSDWKPYEPETSSSLSFKELRKSFFIKERLGPDLESLSSDQASLFECMHQYRDLLFTNATMDFQEDLTSVYALHVLNHIYKARDRTAKNTLKIKTAVLESADIP